MTETTGLSSSVVVSRVERQFSGVPEYARPTFWAHAAQPQHGGLPAWLQEQLSELPPVPGAHFGTRLLTPELHTQALAEIAAAAVMRLPGYEVELGPELEGLTPDLLVTDPHGRQLIAEVWRRGLSKASLTRNPGWAELARVGRRVPVAIALGRGLEVALDRRAAE